MDTEVQWQPAIVRPVKECMAHMLEDYARQTGSNTPPADGLAETRRRLEMVAGKTILVRFADHPQYPCSCGAPVAEIEQDSAQAAQPGWGEYGKFRPTVCSALLYMD